MKKFVVLPVLIVVLLTVIYQLSLSPLNKLDTTKAILTIEPGMSVTSIAHLLKDHAIIRSVTSFTIYARLTGTASKLRAGSYAFAPSMSIPKVIEVLTEGSPEAINITIKEGMSVREIDAQMAKNGLGKEGDILDCAWSCDFSTFDFLPPKPAFAREKGYGSRLEGYLFPETYSIEPAQYQPKFFLERLLGQFRTRIVQGFNEDINTSGKSLHELVIMSSLIEKESRHDEEREIVSGILWKRLKNSVVLGVDAVNRYILEPGAPLMKTDLESSSPYNSRRRGGLPPSPISNAGESSFRAALNPKNSEYWYYLHDPKGIIHYAITLDEHNLNRVKYLGR